MDEFVRTGATEACIFLDRIGAAHLYATTCTGGYKTVAAYYQAGWIFWGCVALALAATFYALKKSISHAFA